MHVVNVDSPEHIQQRRRQRFGLRLIEPRADHQRRLRCDQRDLELFGRNAPDVAQAGSGKCSVHAGEAGAYDDQSHLICSSCFEFSGKFASPPPLIGRAFVTDDDAKTLGRQKREHLGVDEVGMGRAHAVRQPLVDFECAALQQFH